MLVSLRKVVYSVAACALFTDFLVADHWLYVTECNLKGWKRVLIKKLVSLNSTCKRRLDLMCKRRL